ncbi:MAG TPA: hypothetical protein VD999_02250 [Vitreimonas sp.]|nr:hypothetical protein [Vitreimonas sp.]
MTRLLLLPFFLLNLVTRVSLDLLGWSLQLFPFYSLVGSAFFLVVIVFSWWQMATTLVVTSPPPSLAAEVSAALNTAQVPTLTLATDADYEGVIKEIKIWEEYAALQPTHRDVLINLALLHFYLNNQAGAQWFWKQAAQIDPNAPIFTSPLPAFQPETK